MAEDRNMPKTTHDCERCCGADNYRCQQCTCAADTDTVAVAECSSDRPGIDGTNRPLRNTYQRNDDNPDFNVAARICRRPTMRNIACCIGGTFHDHCPSADRHTRSCSGRAHVHG